MFMFEKKKKKKKKKKKSIRRASAVPNLAVINFDFSMAETRLWFKHRVTFEQKSGFTEA